MEENALSKKVLIVEEGTWEILEEQAGILQPITRKPLHVISFYFLFLVLSELL